MICQYLRRSFQRRFLRHFSLFWIMLCAFLLPLVVSTYRDSMEYGARLQLNSLSKGCALHILDAAPEDLELFRNAKDPVPGGWVTEATIETDPGLAWSRLRGDAAVPDCDSLDQDASQSSVPCLRTGALHLRRDCYA